MSSDVSSDLNPLVEGGFAARLRLLKGNMKTRPLARAVGVTDSTVNKYLAGSQPALDKAARIAEHFGVTVGWLATGEGPMRRGEIAEMSSDVVLVPVLDVDASAGAGALTVTEDAIDVMGFHPEWLRLRGVRPGDAVMLRARGDSMEPTIRDGDTLAMNKGITTVEDDGIYVLIANGMVLIKRVQVDIRGGISLTSDNPLYKPTVLAPDEVHELQIVGRLFWSGRGM